MPLRCHDNSFSESENNFKPWCANSDCTRAKRNQCIILSRSRSSDDISTGESFPEHVNKLPYKYNYQYHDKTATLKQGIRSLNHDTSNSEQFISYAKQDGEQKKSGTPIKSHVYESIDSLTPYSKVSGPPFNRQEAPVLNKADIEVINRCDGLINQLQDFTQKYRKLADSYRKNRRLFFILAIVNLTLIACVLIFVPVLMFAPRAGDGRSANVSPERAESKDVKQHRICFNCSELGRDSTFSLETVVGITLAEGECCFKSILSVMQSQNWVSRKIHISADIVKQRLID